VIPGDPTVLGTGDAITAQPAGIEPLTHSTWGDFTDSCDLTSRKDGPHLRALQSHLAALGLRAFGPQSFRAVIPASLRASGVGPLANSRSRFGTLRRPQHTRNLERVAHARVIAESAHARDVVSSRAASAPRLLVGKRTGYASATSLSAPVTAKFRPPNLSMHSLSLLLASCQLPASPPGKPREFICGYFSARRA